MSLYLHSLRVMLGDHMIDDKRYRLVCYCLGTENVIPVLPK